MRGLLCGVLGSLTFAVAATADAQVHCTATFSLDDAVTLGALQIDVDYSPPGVVFDGTGPNVDCANLTAALPTLQDDDAGTLALAFVAFGTGFSGPGDLAACQVTSTGPIDAGDLTVTVFDAADPSAAPVSPLPAASVRLFCDGDTTTTLPPVSTTTTLPTQEVCTVSIEMSDAVTVGSLQLELGYDASLGGFDGTGDSVDCTTRVPALATYFDNEGSSIVTTAIISLSGFSGPRALYDCMFTPASATPTTADFTITVTDAGAPSSAPIVPPPVVVVSAVDCFDPNAPSTTTTLPVCGNELLETGEECDDGNSDDDDGCSSQCAVELLCGDADANLKVTASDAQRILHASVGLPAPCPVAVCDTSGDGTLTVSDSQRVLRFSVGLPSSLLCN